MTAPQGSPADSKAVVNMAEKMQDAGVVPRHRKSIAPFLKQNILTEIAKGAGIAATARRFNVKPQIVYGWRHHQTKRDPSAVSRKPIQPPAADAVPAAGQDSTVTLSALELKMMVTVMRDAMDRVKNPGTKGQLAVLAFKLMDLPGFER